ncbi:hypothetical protein [Novosphingobium clariflavum]|uniref:Uncharacterized protein n=1 Tax=Novosphingobium clariflavum TaxID=2029884 RepID=A0ABV6S1Y2_9SPHN|nr:hypothetical protein [Novosphingobium clariflavum]
MTGGLIALVMLFAGISGFAYWRASRLHRRIVDIDPQARCPATHPLDYFSHRKETRHD